MAPPKPESDHSIYQIKVTLRHSKPPIWRRIQVPSHITLYKMHRILQTVMGWSNSHLHQFIIDGRCYGESHPEYGLEMKTERRARLDDLVSAENVEFVYEYDFGDNWEHQLLVEKILTREPRVHYPICIKGKRACPPEDCGGVWGYGELLEILQHPEDPEYSERLEWLGGSFDPEAFDLDEINHALKNIR